MTALDFGRPTRQHSVDSAISIRDVSKSFRIYHDRNQSLKAAIMRRKRATFEEFWAVKDVSLEIPTGSTFGLMGHNGSGKSTLLKCIAKILKPNAGTIVSNGRLAAMLEVGSGFHPELSGRENVYLNGSILGMSQHEIDSKFDTIVEFAGVGEFIDQPVKNYSSGMYVRLGFSVAIHVDPEILLVDEILAVGDMQFQEKCREKFAEFKESGRTVVVVSHGASEMRNFCDSIAWLDHGKLVDTGPAAEIVDKYSDASHDAREVETGGTRHGTGAAELSRVELLDSAGRDQRRFYTGDQVTLRLHFRTKEPIKRPVFGVSISALDGAYLWAHHSLDGDYVPDMIDGAGSVDVVIPKLPLQPGIFDLSASIVDHTTTVVYDFWRNSVRFDVLAGDPFESGGYLTMSSQYTNLRPPRPIEPPSGRRAAFLKQQLASLEQASPDEDSEPDASQGRSRQDESERMAEGI